jgi:hypothetical protein
MHMDLRRIASGNLLEDLTVQTVSLALSDPPNISIPEVAISTGAIERKVEALIERFPTFREYVNIIGKGL